MNLYQIALPANSPAHEKALEMWEQAALNHAGGYTRLALALGEWRNGAALYQDKIQSYQVACDVLQWAKLVKAAFWLFPDEVAIFHAKLGEATITMRPNNV